jgi:hypothetical protein
VGAGADHVAESGEKLEEDGGGMRLSVRSQGADGQTGEAVEGGFAKFGLLGRAGRLWLWRGERRRKESWAGLLLRLKLRLEAEQFGPATLYVRG